MPPIALVVVLDSAVLRTLAVVLLFLVLILVPSLSSCLPLNKMGGNLSMLINNPQGNRHHTKHHVTYRYTDEV